MKAIAGVVLAGVVSLALSAGGQTTSAPAGDREGVALTVYNGGYGVVRERRMLEIPAGGRVQFADVASAIDPTTVHFQSLTDPNAKLLEQNYQFDLVSADRLLQKYIDKPIIVVTRDAKYEGTLQSFDATQIVIKAGNAVNMIQRPDNVRDITFPSLPEGLITRPTLLWLVATDKPGRQMTEVTYQTGGLNWHAEYLLVLKPDDTSADLSGWISVQNNSGKTYTDARLKFIAGDVRRIQPLAQPEMLARGAAPAAAAEPEVIEKPFFEYHLYTLQRPSTVADNEIKQLEMFTPVPDLQVTKRYLYNPLGDLGWEAGARYEDPSFGVTSEKKVNIFIEFRNSRENHLGIPLPGGKIRVYKEDPQDKAMEFIGEEMINHTPKDEDLSLRIGNAFDVVGERRQTDFHVDSGKKTMQESVEIKIRNHKDRDIVVRVKEPMYRWLTWKITESNQPYKKLDVRNAAWDVPVKADGETTVTYTVEYSW